MRDKSDISLMGLKTNSELVGQSSNTVRASKQSSNRHTRNTSIAADIETFDDQSIRG